MARTTAFLETSPVHGEASDKENMRGTRDGAIRDEWIGY